MKRLLALIGVSVAVVSLVVAGLPASAQTAGPLVIADDNEVTVGSRDDAFSQNKQNEPGVAIDPVDPSFVAAGANDNIDMELCNAGPDVNGDGNDNNDCPFTPGVGVSGFQRSTDGGDTWEQPEYTGFSARVTPSCQGTVNPDDEPDCTPDPAGPIGTLPGYFENDIVSNGDPILAFGPKPDGEGGFNYDDGARLYYSNIATNFPGRQGFKGQGAIGVSRSDDQGDTWMEPVIATKQSSAVFQDKEAVWADNAESSPSFGNVYVCNVAFRSLGGAPEPVVFSRSTDGGDTWTTRQITQAANTGSGAGRSGGRQGCTIRTDSEGVVYVFFNSSFKRRSAQFLARSFDGGRTFEKAQPVVFITEVGRLDPVQGRFTFDGFAGARTNSFPSVDIANGAPSGEGAPDTIVMTWSDARNGLNHEEALTVFSNDGGDSFSAPVNAAAGTDAENGAEANAEGITDDRPDFPAIAISPDGTDVFVTYDGFLDPYRETTADPREYQGVVRHADFSESGFGAFETVNRGEVGDARGSSANGLTSEFLGDYNYVAATNDFGAAVWADDRTSQVCPAINAFRQSLIDDDPIAPPEPQQDCPTAVGPDGTEAFGGTSIFGGSYGDPS